MKATNTVTIRIGMLTVPVKTYTAHNAEPSLTTVSQQGAKVRQVYECTQTGERVPRDAQRKAIATGGSLSILSDIELGSLTPEPTKVLEILSFVPTDLVTPDRTRQLVWLGPDKQGKDPYALLARALTDENCAAIGKWAARGKVSAVAVVAIENYLALRYLHWDNELRSPHELNVTPISEVDDKSAKLASRLIRSYRARKLELGANPRTVAIEALAQKAPAEPGAANGNIVDLMQVLKQSLPVKSNRRKVQVAQNG